MDGVKDMLSDWELFLVESCGGEDSRKSASMTAESGELGQVVPEAKPGAC